MSVYSVDAGDPFLSTLAARLTDGTLWPGGEMPAEPLAITTATVYLPTRRAARALATAFLELAGGPTALPRIETLGESDEEPDLSRPETIGLLEARAALASLVSAFAQGLEAQTEPDQRVLMPTSAPDAVRLADDLLALMDQVETQEADWADLPGLVERVDLAAHWELTTRFLTIATERWPAYLAAAGRISEASARRQDAQTAAASLPAARGPIVVAGSTGSIPATRRLIAAIARHPMGAIVLPGFDRAATTEDWAALEEAGDAPGHPQHGMKQLVDALKIAPADVARLAPPHEARASAPRRSLLSHAMRPAAATHQWLADRVATDLTAALADVALVEAEDERIEAAAIAVAMREAVERGDSVALITPHRPLARRVSHALRRWNIAIDDSAGEPLVSSEAGVFARLVAAVAMEPTAADWLALLKHPFAREMADGEGVRAIEAVLRGPRIAPEAMVDALCEPGGAAAALAGEVARLIEPLTALRQQRPSVGALASAHAAALAGTLQAGRERADVASLADTLARLATCEDYALPARDWPATFDALVSGIVVRGPQDEGAVRILGPLEARLQAFDHAVLGGLNEGVWPATPDAGPWMSRGMMAAFGIDLPERRIGLSAHDFAIAAHAPRLTLTRARRSAGEPTVASRWWQRLSAFAGDAAKPAKARGERLMAFGKALEARPPTPRAERPCPRPPVALRPDRFSVTEVGRLVRDPYAIYAKRLLKLRPLDPLEADPDFGDRGEVIHAVLQRFIAEGHHRAEDAADRFRAVAAAVLAKWKHFPEAQALWGARLSHIAPHVAAAEEARLDTWTTVLTEGEASAQLAHVTLRGRFDRVDRNAEGALDIIDYKSGKPPTVPQVRTLLEPQLPLEAALVSLGGLELAPDAPIAALTYIAVGSGRVPITVRRVDGDKDDATAESLAMRAMEEFRALMEYYRNPATGYLSRARVMSEKDTSGDYDHLARTAEWQSG